MSLKNQYTNNEENAGELSAYTENPAGIPAQIKPRVLELIKAGSTTPLHIKNGLQSEFGKVDYSHISTALERLSIEGHIIIDDSGLQTRLRPAGDFEKKTMKNGNGTATPNHQNNARIQANPDHPRPPFDVRIMDAIRAGENLTHRICVAVGQPVHRVASCLSEMVIDGKAVRVMVSGVEGYFLAGAVPQGKLYLAGNRILSINEPAPPIIPRHEREAANLITLKPAAAINNHIEDLTSPEILTPASPPDKPKNKPRSVSKLTIEAINALPADVVSISDIAAKLDMTPGGVSSGMHKHPTIGALIRSRRAAITPRRRSKQFKTEFTPEVLKAIEDAAFNGNTINETARAFHSKNSLSTFINYFYPSNKTETPVAEAWQRGLKKRKEFVEQTKAALNVNHTSAQVFPPEPLIPVEALLVCDKRLNETVERLSYERGVKTMIESLETVVEKRTENYTTAAAPRADYTARLEQELSENRHLFRKLALERQYKELYGEPSPKAAEVWQEVERKAA